MDDAAHIVVVDDHGDIRDLVQQYLGSEQERSEIVR